MKEFEFTSRIMGTSLEVAIVAESEEEAAALCTASRARLSAYEAQFSRFIPTSELSLLNENKTHTVSPFFISVLQSAQKLFIETEGYFNPLLQIERFGYTDTYTALQKSARTKNLTPYNIDMGSITIDTQTNTITLLPDQKLDFGGFLKGYLAEREAKRIQHDSPYVQGVIVNIGGDIHTRGVDDNGQSFIFEIENPIRGNTISVPLRDMSLATSGTYGRVWIADNQHTHHILARDGTHNTGKEIISTSVIHECGGYAEAYAKALFSIPPHSLEEKVHKKLPYILITQDGNAVTSL